MEIFEKVIKSAKKKKNLPKVKAEKREVWNGKFVPLHFVVMMCIHFD